MGGILKHAGTVVSIALGLYIGQYIWTKFPAP
jgi:hypothetical protein